MTEERGVNKYDNVQVESHVRALYEARQPLQKNDFLYGNEFSSGELVTVGKDGDEDDFLLNNPADSEVYFALDPTYIVGGSRIQIQKKKNVSVDTFGHELSIVSQRTDVPNNTTATVTHNNTYTEVAETEVYPARLVGALKEDTFQVDAEELLVAPGDNALVQATNNTSSDARVTIYLDIIEIPAEIIDTIGADFN